MDIKDLNKFQLLLLAVLLSFVTSIATGITTVTLMQQAPPSVTTPITQVVRETVEKIVPADKNQTLSEDQKKLLENLKAIKPLTVTLLLKNDTGNKVLGTGLFLGDNKVVISSVVPQPKEGEIYIAKSVLGEQTVSKVIPEKDFTVVELSATDTPPDTAPDTEPPTTTGDEVPPPQ